MHAYTQEGYISSHFFSLCVHCVLQPLGTNTNNKGHKLTVQTTVHKICIPKVITRLSVHRKRLGRPEGQVRTRSYLQVMSCKHLNQIKQKLSLLHEKIIELRLTCRNVSIKLCFTLLILVNYHITESYYEKIHRLL